MFFLIQNGSARNGRCGHLACHQKLATGSSGVGKVTGSETGTASTKGRVCTTTKRKIARLVDIRTSERNVNYDPN